MKNLLLVLALVLVGGCSWIDKLPPVQLCVTYKGKTFCASKQNGVWKFEADLTPEERAEVIQSIEGK